MQDEMKSLHDNHTFELMKPPKGKKSLEKQMGIQGEVRITHFMPKIQG